MRRFFFLLFVPVSLLAQSQLTENQKTAALIHIWGLLKYKHPEASRDRFDMDAEFLSEFDKLKPIRDPQALDAELQQWIAHFDSSKNKCKPDPAFLSNDRLFTGNADFGWIKTSGFGTGLTAALEALQNNANYGNHYASIVKFSGTVDFSKDNAYAGFDAGKQAHRILFLAAFWNQMRYWNVNIYLTDTPWEKVLETLLPDFLNEDQEAWQKAKSGLIAALNDSHADYNKSFLFTDKKRKASLYGGKVVNDTLLVTELANAQLAAKEQIGLGDMICSIEGMKVGDFCRARHGGLISTSNETYLKSMLGNYLLLSGREDSLRISLLKRDGTKREQYIRLFAGNEYAYSPVKTDFSPAKKWELLNGNIGYINLGEMTRDELKKIFREFGTTKGLIIDLRNYPAYLGADDVPAYLYPEKKVFMTALGPFAPGYGLNGIQSRLRFINDPFAAGKANKDYYKGKVVLLVNRRTGSQAEYMAMAIQQAPNCTTMGGQTFGAVMNRDRVTLKDNTTVDFTFAGAFYPDGTGVQRKGIKLDREIIESARHYDENAYITEAVRCIENAQKP